MSQANSELPFDGLRVVEAATWIAAPVAATILGDLGADVVKIEQPGEGDPYRALPGGPVLADAGVNYTWLMDARCKRSITVNLKSAEGREIVQRLVRRCDVFVTNYPHPMREKLELSYERLAALNPKMIYASLSAFGERGEERDASGFDQVAYWARSGLADLVRSAGAAPAQGLPGMGDHPTGVSLFASIVTALYMRERTGRGREVHTSLHANGLWANGCMGQAALAGVGFSERRSADTRLPVPATHVLYRTSDDRYLQLNMVRSDDQVRGLFEVLGIAELLDDERFATDEARLENTLLLSDRLAAAIESEPLARWLARLGERGVPASRVAYVEELRSDRQAHANGALIPTWSPDEAGMAHVINHPIGLSGVEGRGATRPPEVGEHTGGVLRELGYEEDDIERLRDEGVV